MRALAFTLLLLITCPAPAHAFWGQLLRGAAKAGSTGAKAGAKAGAVKLAKPVAVGSVAAGLGDDAARAGASAGRAAAVSGDDLARLGGGAAGSGDDLARLRGGLADDVLTRADELLPPAAGIEDRARGADEGLSAVGGAGRSHPGRRLLDGLDAIELITEVESEEVGGAGVVTTAALLAAGAALLLVLLRTRRRRTEFIDDA